MSYKDLLVHLAPGETAANEAAARYAAALAGAAGAHVTGLLYEIDVVPGLGFTAGPLDSMPVLPPVDTTTANAAAREAFARHIEAAAAGVLWGLHEGRSYAYGIGEGLADQLRVRDLGVIGIDPPLTPGKRMLIEAVLFESGRPVILVPVDHSARMPPQSVVVGWDASRTAVRAVADSLPILQGAREVTVVAVADTDDFRAGQSGVELTHHLARHGVTAQFEQVDKGDRDVFGALQAAVDAHAADLLVMGGYGHSRLRELVFGGATRAVFQGRARVPVLLSN